MRKLKIRKYIIIGSCALIAIILLIGMATRFQPAQPTEMKPLTLKDYPELFSKEVIMVVGENATETEREAAEMIKENLKELTGNETTIKEDTELTESDKKNYNLILLGTPTTNSILQEIYEVTDATRVTDEYPGENKGILETLRSPWNPDKTLLILAGNNEWGVKAGSEMLKYAKQIDENSILVEWKEDKAIFSNMIPTDKYIFLEILQQEIIPGQKTWPQESFHGQGFYNFDEATGELKIDLFHATPSDYERLKNEFAINNGLAVIIANKAVIEGVNDWKEGIEKFIYNIPSSCNIAFELPLQTTYLTEDGRIYLHFKDEQISLKPDQKWSIDFKKKWKDQNILHTVTIKNHGLQDKNKIAIEYHYKGGVRPPTPQEKELLEKLEELYKENYE